jgi:hypothetical protein
MRYLNAQHAPYVDKLEAKRIVEETFSKTCDKIKVAKVIRVLESPEDLRESDLDPKHIIKATHGSGWNIFVKSSSNLEEFNTITELKCSLYEWCRTSI